MRSVLRLALLTASLSLWCVAGAAAATLDLVGDFDRPIFVTSSPADPDELFVIEREGRVMRVDGSDRDLFGELESLVSCCASERGLLSIALAPDFPANGRFYAAYTGTTAAGGAEGDIHVDSFRPAPAGGGALLREPILTVGHAAMANHNGGQLQIGPDGNLYVSTGDGGGTGDPLESGQELGSLLGKVLRIDPGPGQGPPYAIPAGNPFADEIWSYGLRNPWRFSFDRLTGDMVIADVGQDRREEVDFAPAPAAGLVGGAGANYGWNCREGFLEYTSPGDSCAGVSGFADPVFDYPHDDPEDGSAHGCSITGGYVVRDPGLGNLFGRYLYADFCVGEIRSLLLPSSATGKATDDRSEGLSVADPVSFGEDSSGRIYVVSNTGGVFRLTPDPAPGGGSSSSRSDPAAAQPGGAGSTRLRLRAVRRAGQANLEIVVRGAPCPGAAGKRIVLKRGGRRFASKRLDDRCTARFRLALEQPATFRALLPAEGYRSQVLTIAFAKPRP